MPRTPVTVYFRYDDYSAASNDVVDRGLIRVFHKYGLCCTFAVIPKVTDGDYRDPTPRSSTELDATKRELLVEAVRAGCVDVALHGFEHRDNGTGMPPSEFSGLSLEEQRHKIREGKALLEDVTGCPVWTFVPPWNTYDDSTISALQESGIRFLSANRYGPASEAAETMRFLPITADLKELEAAVEAASASPQDTPVVGVLMHPYDFSESGDQRAITDLPGLDAKLAWLRACPDVNVLSVSDCARMDETMDFRRYAANRPLARELLVPALVRRIIDIPYYSATNVAAAARSRRLAITLLTYAVAVALGFLSGFLLLRAAHFIPSTNPIVIPLLTIPPIAAVIWQAKLNGELYFSGMALLSAMLAALVGMGAAAVLLNVGLS